jgi:hypothetical protein
MGAITPVRASVGGVLGPPTLAPSRRAAAEKSVCVIAVGSATMGVASGEGRFNHAQSHTANHAVHNTAKTAVQRRPQVKAVCRFARGTQDL